MDFIDELLGIIPKVQTNMIIATVESPPPALKLKYAEQIIQSEQIYCSNYLLKNYHRTYKFDGIIDSQHQNVNQYTFKDMQFSVTGSSMSTEGYKPHTHNITSIGGGGTQGQASGTIESTGNYKHHGNLWLTDTLKKGDEVLVCIVGMFYVVVTKITKMPNMAIEGV